MEMSPEVFSLSAMAPVVLMWLAACLPHIWRVPEPMLWRSFMGLSALALVGTAMTLMIGPAAWAGSAWFKATPFGAWMALLVQWLGLVIGSFSARYLQGEARQRVYVSALAGVLACVHLLLLADHWVVLVLAWALIGVALQQLLCFYPDRAFAQLAAHKKRLADRVADALLMAAAASAWQEVGSGSLSDLAAHVSSHGMSLPLQFTAVTLVLAVILRTALLPVHGWLIQVMEAPTPVSALLHAGVVNLGGVVLIRFASLLEQATLARGLLVVFGMATAVLGGMVMLTRISIKVRLAWSTVAQMGFMLMECGLGLYTLAALHLMGHSLYKAHTFLSTSDVVRSTRMRALYSVSTVRPSSLALSPLLGIAGVLGLQVLTGVSTWPWWWSVALGLAWAPLLWLPSDGQGWGGAARHLMTGLAMLVGLTGVAMLAHLLPLGIADAPAHGLGWVAMAGLAALYLCLVALQCAPERLQTWRRWSYAGFYLDDAYTRLALQWFPARWSPVAATAPRIRMLAGPRAESVR